MKRPRAPLPILAAFAWLGLSALPAHGAGYVNLAWNDCGIYGSANRAFACNTNTGINQLFVSFEPPVTMYQLDAMELVMAVSTSNYTTLSPWWHMETAGCRAGSLTAGFDFVGGPFNCADVWAGQASGGSDYTASYYGVNRSRIRAVCAVPYGLQVDPGTEYYGMTIRFNNAKTVGTGSCPGCVEGACFSIISAKLYQPAGVGDYLLSPGQQTMATWNGGSPFDCVVPTRTKSWGQIKSLYR